MNSRVTYIHIIDRYRYIILNKEEHDLLIFILLQGRQEKISVAKITRENLRNHCN